jgi:hypothetical protein
MYSFGTSPIPIPIKSKKYSKYCSSPFNPSPLTSSSYCRNRFENKFEKSFQPDKTSIDQKERDHHNNISSHQNTKLKSQHQLTKEKMKLKLKHDEHTEHNECNYNSNHHNNDTHKNKTPETKSTNITNTNESKNAQENQDEKINGSNKSQETTKEKGKNESYEISDSTNNIINDSDNTSDSERKNIIPFNKDEKILFSLRVIGRLQKNEKLTVRDGLPSIDDRYFKSLSRWYTGDSRHKTSDLIYKLCIQTLERVQELLNQDYESKIIKEENNSAFENKKLNRRIKESPEEKHFREICEDRRRKISAFFETLPKTKQGIENLKDTYTDNFTKEKLFSSLVIVEETLNKLRKFN